MPEALQVPQGMQRRATLVDLLDRVLGKGVVAYGDVILSIADLDLIYLNLRAVLSSIGTLEREGWGQREWAGAGPSYIPPISGGAPESWEEVEEARSEGVRDGEISRKQEGGGSNPITRLSSPSIPQPKPAGKLELDPKKMEQGLTKLVLTLINLLRKLMERQAIRRIGNGTLTAEQLERTGEAFQRLDERIKELCEQFGLKEEDLNLDLGPLGELV